MYKEVFLLQLEPITETVT